MGGGETIVGRAVRLGIELIVLAVVVYVLVQVVMRLI